MKKILFITSVTKSMDLLSAMTMIKESKARDL